MKIKNVSGKLFLRINIANFTLDDEVNKEGEKIKGDVGVSGATLVFCFYDGSKTHHTYSVKVQDVLNEVLKKREKDKKKEKKNETEKD